MTTGTLLSGMTHDLPKEEERCRKLGGVKNHKRLNLMGRFFYGNPV